MAGRDNRRRDKFSRQDQHFGGRKQDNNPLVEVWQETCRYFRQMNPELPPAQLVEMYSETEPTLPRVTAETRGPAITVENLDCLALAHRLVKAGVHPLVLNMASEMKPGGGVRSGKPAQEECIFRSTSAFLSHPKEWYPLTQEQMIYVPQVIVGRGPEDTGFAFLGEAEYAISLMTVPALRKPRLVKGQYSSRDREYMLDKIRAIFRTAVEHHHDVLVLGALGCGAFGNPPREVAALFHQALQEFPGCFRQISFAILVVKETDQANLTAFREQFGLAT